MRRIALHFILVSVAGGLAAAPLAAQSLRWVHHTGKYWALGVAGGNFNVACDSGCVGRQQSAQGLSLTLGRHLRPGIRFELTGQYQRNAATQSHTAGLAVGLAVYVTNSLHLFGGASMVGVKHNDAIGEWNGSAFPSLQLGAGYDVFLGRTLALTPYVSYSSGSVSTLDLSGVSGAGGRTSGRMKTLNIGVKLNIQTGSYECTTASGQKVLIDRYMYEDAVTGEGIGEESTLVKYTAARFCLEEVARKFGRRPASRR
jgi:hypothetical protein